jgi:hypothetical protein
MTRTAAFSVALVSAAVSSTAAAGTVHFDNYNGHDYAFVASSADFDGAQDTCELMGMDLVTINSLAEQDYVIERAFLSTPTNAHAGYLNTWIWIGAVNDDVDGDMDVYDAINDSGWRWISGERMTVTDFDGAMDQDSWNYDNHGAAVTITGPWTTGPFGPGHEWRISPASYHRAFVCEE